MKIDSFNRVQFELNGYSFNAYQGSVEGVERLEGFGYIRLGDSDLFISGNSSVSHILKAAGYHTFDWSKPQAWFDAYIAEHGVAPHGVWYYPPKPDPDWLGGRFVSVDEAIKRFGQNVAELWKVYNEVESEPVASV